MMLLDLYDGYAVIAIHWTELRHVVDTLDGIDPPEGMSSEHMTSLHAALEAAMLAGRFQVELPVEDEKTLRQVRRELGLRDWQPSDALYERRFTLDTATVDEA